nr:FeoA domain-containing protein [Clostridium sp. chh4-2]
MGDYVVKLYEGEIGRPYIVQSIIVEDKITRRLEALGVNEQTKIIMMNKKGSGTVIIKVRGTRLALGRRISEGIEIKEASEDAARG